MKIELVEVAKRFGKVEALAGVSLAIPAGRKVALIGPNGSGKTTLIRALLGLISHRGTIVVDGKPLDRAALAPRIAYVPQIAPRIAASCRELVRAVCDLRSIPTARVEDLAARLDLPFDAIAKRPFRGLSGGSKQKLLLALALATAPELLVLDEPTASLDAEARGRFFRLQRELAPTTSLVLCSHRLEEIRALVDHVAALDDGKLIYDGPAAHYLDQRVGCVLEIKLRSSPASEREQWLTEHGFAVGGDGWWSRAVDRQAKLTLVPAALAALGDAIDDLAVRDVDLVELEARDAA